MVDDLEALRSGRVVCPADVHARLELRLGMVTQERQDGDDGLRGNVERQLVFDDAKLLDELGQAFEEMGAVSARARRGKKLQGAETHRRRGSCRSRAVGPGLRHSAPRGSCPQAQGRVRQD